MKVAAQQVRPEKGLKSRPVVRRGQPKARPGAANRHRSDFYEMQADQIANRVMRGEREVSQYITGHPVAGFSATGSNGFMLPPTLRHRMEDAFGAELSDLRIHSGTAANIAAADHDAQAFTSGRNIYFGRHQYSPHTAGGRWLLAHEIAHVLQQTGRRDAKGRLRALDLEGSAEVQCKDTDEFVTLADGYNVFQKVPDWDSIKKAYEGVTDLATHTEIIESYFPDTFPMAPDEVSALALETTDPGFAKFSDEIKGLYVDALKMVGGYDEAAKVLAANVNLPTSFRSKGLYEVLRKQTLGWLYKMVTENAVAKDYFPGRFVSAYRTFFLIPGLGVGDLDPTAKKAGGNSFSRKLLDEIGRLKDGEEGKKLGANELLPCALLALYYLDDGRKKALPQQLQTARAQGKSVVESLKLISESYVKQDADALSPSAQLESTALFAAVLPSIQEAASAAAKFWNRTIDLQAAQRMGTGFKGMTADEVKAIVGAIKTDTRFRKMPRVLLDTATEIFARPKGNLLSPGTFATRIDARRAALETEMASYGPRIAELIQQGKDAEPEGLRLGLATGFLSDVEQVLAKYDPVTDKDLSKKKRADIRIAVRIRLAHTLLNIATLFEWNDLRDAANGVFKEGLQLALLSDWEWDSTADLGDLSKQIENITGFEGTKISGGLLDRYLYVQYFEILSAELSRLLRERADDFTDQISILQEGFEKAKTDVGRPRRFIVHDWEVGDPEMANEKGVTPPAASDLGAAIFAHPLTKEYFGGIQLKNEWSLAPTYLRPPDPLFIWLVPRMDEFIKLIAKLEVVRKAVEAQWTIDHPGTDAPNPEVDPFAWLDALKALAIALNSKAGTPDEIAKRQQLLDKIGGAISEAAEGKLDQAKDVAHAKGREATSHERRVLVEKRLQPLLKSYNRNDLSKWEVPKRAFNVIRLFAEFVWPKEDQVLQVSAMVLEVAQELMQAFGPIEGFLGASEIRRFDIIDIVLTLATETLRVWDAGEAEIAKAEPGSIPPVNPIAAISWISQSDLALRAEMLRKLRDTMAEKAEAEQRRNGLRGKKSTNRLSSVYWDEEGFSLIKMNMSHEFIEGGKGFSLYGTDYLVIEVYETFTFHPGFGAREALGVAWPKGAARAGDAKLLDEAGNERKPNGTKLFSILMKPRFGDPTLIDVTDKDFDNLAKFSTILSEHFGFEYIAAGGVFIEKYVSLIMDVLEFLPGIGQGLATARFVANIMQTLTSPEFLELLEAFNKDGFGAFEKIFTALASVVNVQELANVLIFDADFKASTKSHESLRGKDDRQKKISAKGGAWASIGKVLKSVIELGVRILERLKRLVMRVQVPIRDAQLWVLRTPVAIVILEIVETAFDFLSSLTIDDLVEAVEGVAEKGFQEMIKQEALKAAQQVTDRARDTLDTLRHLELPEVVIPVEVIIDFVVDLAVRALSAKYRKPAQAVRGVLRTIGLWDKILKVITDNLYAAGADPNELYRQHVRSKVQPWLTSVRDEFSGEVTKTLKSIPFLGAITQPKGTPVTLDFSGEGFPEAEGYQASPEKFGFASPNMPLPGTGSRLPRGELLRAEAALGHDFRHVRLHTGPEADRVTGNFNAEAITTGSHVFLRSGLDPAGASGRRILHHELAHVVQQTGARPLGHSSPDSPSIGKPGVGLMFDARREAAANKAAENSEGGVAAAPIVPGGQAVGIQPAFTSEFLRKFLSRLHKTADIYESREEVQREVKTGVTLDAASKEVADAIGPALKRYLGEAKAYQQPFRSVHNQLKVFAEDRWTEFEAAIPVLVSRAIMTVSPPKGAEDPSKMLPWLQPESLKVQLERYLYALTSFAFVLEMGEIKAPKNLGNRQTVSKKKPIKKAFISYVHLPLLPQDDARAEQLWDLLVENTFRGKKDYNKTSHDSFKAATKLVLGRGTPSPDVYESSQFKLTYHRVKVIRNQRDRLIEYVDKTKTATWPVGTEYVNTSTTAGLGDLGLRLGTYATWGPPKVVEDRDAHHIVQYLLFEYFRNVKKKKPFPLLGTQNYPGVMVGSPSSEVKSIGKIDIDTYFHGRGGAMTTIFIARTTHQSGIHYRSEPPDDGSSSRTSQGSSIDNTFRDLLGGYEPVLKDPVILQQLEQNEKDNKHDQIIGTSAPPITVNAVKSKIFYAAQETYKDMWKEMKPKLRTALNVQEVAYYNSVAKLRGETTIDKTVMTAPFQTVAAESEKEIGTTAGFSPGYSPL